MTKKLFTVSLIGVITFLSVIFFYSNSVTLDVILVILSLAALANERSGTGTAIFIFTIIIGTFFEIGIVHAGAWKYPFPDFYAIPAWIPLGWGIIALFFRQLNRKFK